MIGTHNRFNKVKRTITYDCIGPAIEDKWMIILDMSFLIVHKYKHMVVLLSIEIGQSETFFNLCGAPSQIDRTAVIFYGKLFSLNLVHV